ncbi:MAG: glycosyltransferase [Anaerolineae bacterium]
MLINWRQNAAMGLFAVPLGLRAQQVYDSLPRLAWSVVEGPFPSLSIIVPARNESANLRRLLPTLTALEYPGEVEIIVVDDGSTDDTGDIARSFGARVIRLDGLPFGWLGKPHACHKGALAARGEWLLFTDADTAHAPDGPAQAVRTAMARGWDGLSLFLDQQSFGLIDRLTLDVAYAGLFAGLQRDAGILNGQYILLRREVYERTGGFGSVKDEMIEDVALGAVLRREGFETPMMRGENAAKVYMYADTRQMWHGMARLASGSMQHIGLRSLITMLFVTAQVTPLMTVLGVLTGKVHPRWLLLSWGAASLGMLPWTARRGRPWLALLGPVGGGVVFAASLWGMARKVVGGGIHWRGRRV